MKCERRNFPPGAQEAGAHQREEMVAAESLEEPDAGAPWGIEPVVPTEPASLQGLPVEGELRSSVEIPLSGGDAQLPEQVDGPTEGVWLSYWTLTVKAAIDTGFEETLAGYLDVARCH